MPPELEDELELEELDDRPELELLEEELLEDELLDEELLDDELDDEELLEELAGPP